MTTPTIRDATEHDAAALLAIYNHEVQTGTATLDLETRSLEGQVQWLRARQGANPVVVGERDGEVVGFASLSPFKDRAAYRTTVENSIYVAADAQGQGVGRLLLGERNLATNILNVPAGQVRELFRFLLLAFPEFRLVVADIAAGFAFERINPPTE